MAFESAAEEALQAVIRRSATHRSIQGLKMLTSVIGWIRCLDTDSSDILCLVIIVDDPSL